MSEIARKFVDEFHSIPGVTVKEKQQNLFRLLHKNISLRESPDELDHIAANLEPANHLEKIFRVDVLVYFRRFKELYQDFKDGDEIVVRKTSKQDWFFQTAFEEVGAEDFVNNILPTVSYSLKMKVLKKIPLEERQADEFFDAVCRRYEIFLATNLLPKCSNDKIRQVMTAHPVTLTVAQQKTIFDKDPELMRVYFEEKTNHKGDSKFINHNPILIRIAQKDPKMFSELFGKYKFETGLGRRTTKRLIDSQKEEILKKPEDYINILNKSATIRRLGKELKGLLFKKQSEISDFYWKALLKHYPKSRRFAVFRSSHDSRYRHKLGENLEEMSEDVLEVMDDCDEREHYAKLKIEKEDNENYLKYVKADYCLKKFMEKVNHMKSPERAKYVDIATYCCILNKDFDSLLKVCELVCVRFKNDDRTIRESFFRNLVDKVQIMENFNEQHWKFVMEILATSKAKDGWVNQENEIIAYYLKYLIENNKSIKEMVQKDNDWDQFAHTKVGRDPKVFKPVMTAVIETGITKLIPNDELCGARFDCKLAAICKTFNENNPKDALSVCDHPRILKSVREMLEKHNDSYVDWMCSRGVRYVVHHSTPSEELKEIRELYFEQFKLFGDVASLLWFLKHDPKTLEENLDQYLDSFAHVWSGNPKKQWRLVKKYSHLELDTRTVEFCKLKLKEEFEYKEKLVRPLTMLSSPSSHLEFIKSYIPASYKIDFTDDEAKELYKIQGKLFRLLTLVDAPTKVLPLSLELCKGDYLQFALSPVYSHIYRLPENETKPYIAKLEETKAVSVKKHAMNLSCVIYDADSVYTCLKSSTVPSLTAALKYFAKNPSSALWKLIEEKIRNLSKNELQELKSGVNIVVPFKYKSQFVELAWNVLEKNENKEFKKVLLPTIGDKTIETFRSDFAFRIVRENIFQLEEANSFIANLLIHLKTEEKFGVWAEILAQLKTSSWNDKEQQRQARKKLKKFIHCLFEKYMTGEEPDQEFASRISTIFKSFFSSTDAFEEWVLLSLMALKGETPENCGKLLAELNHTFEQKYGNFTVNWFASTITNFALKHAFTTSNEKIKLCHALFKQGESINNYILVLKLLPKKEPKEAEDFALYEEIFTKLSQIRDDVLELQFNSYLSSSFDASPDKVPVFRSYLR